MQRDVAGCARSRQVRWELLFVAFTAWVTLCVSAAAQARWEQRFPATVPTARDTHGMAFDATTGRMVMFGGFNLQSFMQLDDTWEWDGQDWHRIQVASGPIARETFGFATDPAGGVLLFGGYNFTQGVLRDTWRYSSGVWTQLSNSGPAARRSMPIVSTGRSIILFGGGTGLGNLFDDTWEWIGGSWIQRTPATHPSPRWGHAMAYDSHRDRVVLFGGGDARGNRVLSDTWEWDGANWQLMSPTTSPPAGSARPMADDERRRRVVMFGGITAAAGETWEWDGTNWTEMGAMTGPPHRWSHAAAYDARRERVVMFGGRDSVNGSRSDIWELVPTIPGSFATFGSGCPGTAGTPTMDAENGQLPWIGETFTVRLDSLPVAIANVPFGLLGASNTRWLTFDLPLDLSFIGMDGCVLYVSADAAFTLMNAGGTARWDISIPALDSLLGAKFYLQGLVFDPGANNLGATVTNAGDGTIGSR